MAADSLKNGPFDRDVEQAITALKKGTHLLKYGQRGKPKFCPFRLSNDETVLIWYSGRMEKQLNLTQVSKIIPGQRTAIFLRHPIPDKEYQSFSLIYGQRSLDMVCEILSYLQICKDKDEAEGWQICKDKDEAEAWFVGLKALIARQNCEKWTIETKSDKASDSPTNHTQGDSPLASSCYSSDVEKKVHELTHKSELLEAELDKTNNQLREARTTVDVENLKCKAAKEVISSLTSQIKSTTERAPEGCTINGTWTDQVYKLLGSHFCENHLNDFSRSPPDSSAHLVHQLPCKGNSTVTDTEWIEQVEHGVYITLFRSPAGHKYIRRVRFSKRRFTEQQAERWWAGHRSTLQEQYGILTGDIIIPSRTIQGKGYDLIID